MQWRTSLMVQWLRVCLPMQGTLVRSLVQESPRTTGQLSPCATTPEAWAPQSLCSTTMKSPHTQLESSPRLPQPEKARTQQQRPSAAPPKKCRGKKQSFIIRFFDSSGLAHFCSSVFESSTRKAQRLGMTDGRRLASLRCLFPHIANGCQLGHLLNYGPGTHTHFFSMLCLPVDYCALPWSMAA